MYTHVVCKVTRYFLFLEAWYICGHIWLYVVHIYMSCVFANKFSVYRVYPLSGTRFDYTVLYIIYYIYIYTCIYYMHTCMCVHVYTCTRYKVPV